MSIFELETLTSSSEAADPVADQSQSGDSEGSSPQPVQLISVYPTDYSWKFPYAGDYIGGLTDDDLGYFPYNIESNSIRHTKSAEYFPNLFITFWAILLRSDPFDQEVKEVKPDRSPPSIPQSIPSIPQSPSIAYLLQSDTRPDILF